MDIPPARDRLGERAAIALSGGQDSTTCLYWALTRFEAVEAVAFDYQQRHRIELEAARAVAARARVPLTILPISSLPALGGNALTDASIAIRAEAGELPSTFVPGRNLIFLTLLAAYALPRGIRDLVTGVCETDYSGYPDCRDETMASLERTLALGMGEALRIHRPLMWLNKAQTVELAAALPGALAALSDSHTCYAGARPPCGGCPACQLRAAGFDSAGVADPLAGLSGPEFSTSPGDADNTEAL